MNQDRLRLDLADLANEVTPVDLRDRALRTSRRLGIQRAIATSAAAVVMVGAATGTAFALMPRNDGQAPMPADSPSITVTPSPVEVSPTPETSGSAEAPGTATSSAPTQPEATIGRIFYGLAPSNVDRQTGPLWSFKPGGSPTRLMDLPSTALYSNVMVSPDGKRVAWVEPDRYLRVANVDGSEERKLSAGDHPTTEPYCWTPTWSPDSSKLMMSPILEAEPNQVTEKGIIDLATGRYGPIANVKGCHPLWSADGRVLAYANGEGRVALGRPDGSGERFIPNLSTQAQFSSFDVSSLSPDGSRIALKLRQKGDTYGDVGRELDANAVLDTRTGKKVNLPLGGRTMRQAYFQADGTLVARVASGNRNALVLIGTDGKKISETQEPTALKDMQILQIVS